MGLCLSVYRWAFGDCTNNGTSANVQNICVINIPGPSSPSAFVPAFVLALGPSGDPILKPANNQHGFGPMFGGNFAYTCDSRLSEAVNKMTGCKSWGALPIFDRFESVKQYNRNLD